MSPVRFVGLLGAAATAAILLSVAPAEGVSEACLASVDAACGEEEVETIEDDLMVSMRTELLQRDLIRLKATQRSIEVSATEVLATGSSRRPVASPAFTDGIAAMEISGADGEVHVASPPLSEA
eukprot:CAMPEP_0115482468 /NCGR_PEP_ID=MMETSP0271-20121206/58348_1 /TAXON_ID=71861 /ORGANISM="Scrippsiella trochoidea, Strain CCMP3099" /LENGTH=123 /DNA_ID=CAMNT_0002910273 /DNA_START=32 /DNA_END=403 /DNA_ORIENTATION=-